MHLYEYKPFQKQVARLVRSGGDGDMAYREVVAAINNWRHRLPVTLARTKNGENRIPHAVKYDLYGDYRLVTVEHEDARILVFVGSHVDAERWLDGNRGATFVVNKRGQIDFTRVDAPPPAPSALQEELPLAPRLTGPILEQLPQDARELLSLPRPVTLVLRHFTFELLLDDDEAWETIHALPFDSDLQRSATLDVINHLRHGQVKQAIARVEAFADEATASPEAVAAALVAGTGSDTIADLTALSDAEFEHRFRNSGYTEWLLFLHPDQRKHVEASHSGPNRLIGVSGSGKTCVLVHRASALAKRYPGQKILVLVLNESLRQLLTSLVAHLCPEEQRQQIEILRIYDYCYRAVKTITPRAVINTVDEISGEDLAMCWRDFTNRPHALEETKTLRASIKAMLVDPWGYLHDELIWVRTGTGGTRPERQTYLTTERRGRALQFPMIQSGSLGYDSTRTTTGFRADARARVLRLLEFYEEYMAVGGLLDEDGVALMAHDLREQITQHASLRARCVLVDEVQDLSTTQLGVIAKIPTSEEDGLMLVGDPVQKVFPRQQHLKSAGIDIKGRASRLNTNYRNTREILDAAYPIIEAYRTRSPVPEDEILQPELACRHGPRPKLVVCVTAEEQWACVEFLIRHLRNTDNVSICVGSPRPAIRIEPRRNGVIAAPAKPQVDATLLDICDRERWPVIGIEGKVQLAALAESVVGAKFEDMKGFEFKNVLLVDLHDRRLVSAAIPREEHWRVAFQVYVAMTRAQEALWMFSVGAPSQLLQPLEPHVDRMTADQLLGRPSAGLSRSVGDRDSGETLQDLLEWSGDAEKQEVTLAEDETESATASNSDATDSRKGDIAPQESDEDAAAERLELPFEPDITSTADVIHYADEYRNDPDTFEQIMLELNNRDCSSFVSQISELRAHWLMLVRREGHRKLVNSGTPEWPKQAIATRSDALSGKVFPYEQGMLSFMGYKVGAASPLTTMERRKILTYVYFGALPTVIDDNYTRQWGAPGSRKRLIKLKNTLLSLVRNAQRRAGNMHIAIDEWQEDLHFIHEAFG
jgi:superfamily I DNA/RNA helicase